MNEQQKAQMNEQQKAQVDIMMRAAQDDMRQAVPDGAVRDTANLLCLIATTREAFFQCLKDHDIRGAADAFKAVVHGLTSAAAELTVERHLSPLDVTIASARMLVISKTSMQQINAYLNGGKSQNAPGSASVN